MKNIHKKINFNFCERIAKRIASSGVCSRREAEKLIIEGKVKLNDKIVFQCNLNVSKNDLILVDGKSIPKKEPIRLWLFYKEKGFLVTNNDPQGRPTIFEKMRLLTVGGAGYLGNNLCGAYALLLSGLTCPGTAACSRCVMKTT